MRGKHTDLNTPVTCDTSQQQQQLFSAVSEPGTSVGFRHWGIKIHHCPIYQCRCPPMLNKTHLHLVHFFAQTDVCMLAFFLCVYLLFVRAAQCVSPFLWAIHSHAGIRCVYAEQLYVSRCEKVRVWAERWWGGERQRKGWETEALSGSWCSCAPGQCVRVCVYVCVYVRVCVWVCMPRAEY